MKIEGTLKGFGERKRGTKKDGAEWILYSYTLEVDGKEKTLTGFDKVPELLGEVVEIEYESVQEGERHYNNLTSIEKKGEIDEVNKQYNVVDIEQNKIDNKVFNERGAFFGMISNQTLAWLEHIETLGKLKLDANNFDVTWSGVFDKLWKLNEEKRKEKLK